MQGAHDPAIARLHEVTSRIHARHDLDEVLQAIADGVVEVSGFQATTINVLLPDGHFELKAVGGTEPDLEGMLHTRYPSSDVLDRNASGERWGMFRFIPHTATKEIPAGFRSLDFEPIDHPDAWHPLDELSVTLHSPTGDLIGIMYVDHPVDGLRPSPETLAVMETYAVQAGIAINHAQQREKLREAGWLSGLMHTVVDTIAGPLELETKLDSVLSLVRMELSAGAAWLDVFASDDPASLITGRGDEGVFTVSAALGSYGATLAADAMDRSEALVLDRRGLARDHRLLTPEQRTWLTRAFDLDGIDSLVLAPLNNDQDLAGQLVLMRGNDRPWSEPETQIVREVARELGWAIGRDRSRARERIANEELDRSKRERREQLESIASEVQPLFAAVDGYLSSTDLPVTHPARLGMEKFWTLFERVGSLVGFEQPDRPPAPQSIDMHRLLAAQWSHLDRVAQEMSIQLLPLDAPGGQYAWADAEQLEWLTQLLLEDVLHSAKRGSSVRVSVVTLNGRLVLSCQTSGLDEAPEFQRRASDRVPDNDVRWWRTGVDLVLARQDGRFSSRSGPLGRRVLSVSLPVPPPETAGV